MEILNDAKYSETQDLLTAPITREIAFSTSVLDAKNSIFKYSIVPELARS